MRGNSPEREETQRTSAPRSSPKDLILPPPPLPISHLDEGSLSSWIKPAYFISSRPLESVPLFWVPVIFTRLMEKASEQVSLPSSAPPLRLPESYF